MTQPITLSIRMFGAFRKFHPGTLEITVPSGSTTAAVKTALADTLRQEHAHFNDELISKSVLADNQRVLDADETITTPLALAILPPVCGG